MFAATRLSRSAPQVQRFAQQARTVVSGPPREKITPAEKLVHGAAMVMGFSLVPIWVLLNIKNYKSE